jgi:hypothetical protein
MAFQCGLTYREFWDEVTYFELLEIYRGYQMRLLDQYELGAWVAANIMTASSGKRVNPRKLFDRKKAEKRLFAKRYDYQDLKEKYQRAKKIAEEVRNLGNRRARRS